MITLRFGAKHTKFTTLPAGAVVTLRIRAVKVKGPGRWEIWVDDITPLPEAEPTSYACTLCDKIEKAAQDGGLPKGWVIKKFPTRSLVICKECQETGGIPYCRVCGCTQEDACWDDKYGNCHWVEEDLCSACEGKGKEKTSR